MADVQFHDGYVLQSWKDLEGDASEYGPKVWLSGGSVNLESGDIEIGAVEIKDATSTNRAGVSSEGNVYVELRDSAGNDRGVGVNSDNELKVQVNSDTHDDCNLNANLQVGDSDVDSSNPVPIESSGTTISQTPTVTAGAYSANDAVGGLLTFANAARTSGGGGVIKGTIIIDDAGQDAELELWLFNQTFTAESDNAAWSPSEADLENCIGVISTQESSQGWMAAGTPSVVDIEVSRRYDLTGTSLFGQLVTRGTPTYAATDDVTVKVCLLTD